MKRPMLIRQEYRYVCEEMRKLAAKGGYGGPLPKDVDLYCRLAAVKKTLEWVHSGLIKTQAKGADRMNELCGCKHYVHGPTFAELYP